jgi:hypothetical protein
MAVVRTYMVQPGDSPARIAARDDMAGCPKCSVDLVWANPHKLRKTYPNGYVTFESLSVGELLYLPEKWFDGTLDRMPKGYFAALPTADGGAVDQGLGARPQGLGDLTSQPAYQQALSSITSQMQNEGQPSLSIAGAQQAFANIVDELVTNTDAGSAIQSAQSYVLGVQTIGGAVSTIAGLLQGPQGATTAQAAASFVGQMVGVMSLIGTVAGVSTAGIGAAIVGGLTFVLEAMDAAHLFGAPLGGTALCHCSEGNTQTNTSSPPAYAMPCPVPWGASNPNLIGVLSDPLWDPSHKTGIQPGSSNWRSFPASTITAFVLTVPSVWFSNWTANPSWTPPGQQPIYYAVCPCPGGTNGGNYYPSALRLIDIAFPLYHQMECEMAGMGPLVAQLSGGDPEITSALIGFESAFFSALKANWEYALNGIGPPASDIDVLAHTIFVWNRAHAPGKGLDIQPSTATPWTPNGTTCDGSAPPWYAAILAPQAGSQQQLPGVMNGNLLHINTGALLPFSLPSSTLFGGVQAPTAPTTSSTGSTVATVALVLVGGSAAALGIYAATTHQSFVGAASRLYKSIIGGL